jgi:hypothetical protein
MVGTKEELEQKIKYLFGTFFGESRVTEEWYNRVHPHFGASPAELVESGKGQEFLEYIKHATGRGSR